MPKSRKTAKPPLSKIDAAILAADNMDWGQPAAAWAPCFHICEDGRFCGRAPWWPGHDMPDFHKHVPLATMLRSLAEGVKTT